MQWVSPKAAAVCVGVGRESSVCGRHTHPHVCFSLSYPLSRVSVCHAPSAAAKLGVSLCVVEERGRVCVRMCSRDFSGTADQHTYHIDEGRGIKRERTSWVLRLETHTLISSLIPLLFARDCRGLLLSTDDALCPCMQYKHTHM